ncbi:hypothetical protein EST38_g11999, partial [Candolleomyces aberdarensis]
MTQGNVNMLKATEDDGGASGTAGSAAPTLPLPPPPSGYPVPPYSLPQPPGFVAPPGGVPPINDSSTPHLGNELNTMSGYPPYAASSHHPPHGQYQQPYAYYAYHSQYPGGPPPGVHPPYAGGPPAGVHPSYAGGPPAG